MSTVSRRNLLAVGMAYIGMVCPGMATILTLPDPESDHMVLMFDISQNFGLLPAGAIDGPLLEVMADGRMSARAVAPGAGPVVGTLSPEDLRDLISFVVDEQDFFAIDADEIAAQIEQIGAQDGRRLLVADAPTTHVSVMLKDHTHTVSLYAVGFSAMLFPEIDALQRLRRIELRLLETTEALRAE
jgi:hypothetical protein